MKARLYTAALFAVLAAVACSSDPVSPAGDNLAGLTRLTPPDETDPGPTRSDTATATRACTSDSAGVCPGGFFHGFVVGAVVGSDSSDVATRVPDVRVTLYAITGWRGDVPIFGAAISSTVSASDGSWQFSKQSAGVYGFTFEPPASSKYRGAWTIGTANPSSGDYRWWISLTLK